MLLLLCQYHVALMTRFLVYSEVREPDLSSSDFIFQDCFGYSGFFCLHTNFEIFFVVVLVLWKMPLVIWEELHWICILPWLVILTILIILIHEHDIFFYLCLLHFFNQHLLVFQVQIFSFLTYVYSCAFYCFWCDGKLFFNFSFWPFIVSV